MKRIGITQRVEYILSQRETRDALDRRWPLLCTACNLVPIPLPNHLSSVQSLVDHVAFDGFLFSGGNSLCSYGGESPERDKMEIFLLEHAINQNLPVLGVCRGMQLIQHFFGLALKRIEGHVQQEHTVTWEKQSTRINSFHHFGTTETNAELLVLAQAEDGIIEAIKHRDYPLTGIMWHPERNDPFQPRDITLLTQIFGTA